MMEALEPHRRRLKKLGLSLEALDDIGYFAAYAERRERHIAAEKLAATGGNVFTADPGCKTCGKAAN